MYVEDRLQAASRNPGPDHQCHPVELLIGEMCTSPIEPGVVEAEMIEGEPLSIINGDPIGFGVARPRRPLGHMGVVVFCEIVLR